MQKIWNLVTRCWNSYREARDGGVCDRGALDWGGSWRISVTSPIIGRPRISSSKSQNWWQLRVFLRRKNWARWLALAWMALHVAISFPVIAQVAIHLCFLAVIGGALFRSTTRGYFC